MGNTFSIGDEQKLTNVGPTTAFEGLMSIKDYRLRLNDYTSTDEQIRKRLLYLEGFCRNIARLELQKLKAT